jgi:RimJ/RimL family protein N-acetyltransferase
VTTWLSTPRLRLRPLTLDDVDDWVALHADPKVSEFVGSYTPQRARERIAGVERMWTERGHGLCAVELAATGAFIGRGGLQYWPDFDEVETAWTLRSEHWGHGYATEAAAAFVDWGFAHLGCDYLTAMIHHGNEASVRVASRLGFTPSREDVLGGRPVTVYALTRTAYTQAATGKH